jgi:hypothetical protein
VRLLQRGRQYILPALKGRAKPFRRYIVTVSQGMSTTTAREVVP